MPHPKLFALEAYEYTKAFSHELLFYNIAILSPYINRRKDLLSAQEKLLRHMHK